MDPFSISIVSMTAVFLSLTVLALVMEGLTRALPGKPPVPKRSRAATAPDPGADASDDALYAAITTAVTAAFPGSRVTKIEERT